MSERVRNGLFEALSLSWPLLAIAVALSLLGVLTMHPFGEAQSLAPRQLIWIGVGIVAFLTLSSLDMHLLRSTSVLMAGYLGVLLLLVLLLLVADPVQGARAWFSFGAFSFQPADLAKIVLIAVLAKY